MFWMFWGDVKQIYYFYIFLLLLKCFYKHGGVYMYHYTSDDDGCILKQDNSFKREKLGIGYIRSNFYIRKKMKWEKTVRWSTILTKDQFNLEQRNWIWQMALAFFKEKGWGMLREHSNWGIFYVTCYIFLNFFDPLKWSSTSLLPIISNMLASISKYCLYYCYRLTKTCYLIIISRRAESFCSLLASFCLLLIAGYFSFVAYYLLLVARYFVLLARYFLLVDRYFLVVAVYSLLVVRYLLFIACYFLLVGHYFFLVVCYFLLTVR